MDTDKASEKETSVSWERLPQSVKDFADDKLDSDTKLKSKFIVKESGLVEFAMDLQIDGLSISVFDRVSGEIEPRDKRIVVSHETEQMAAVLDTNDPESGGGGSIMSIPEDHKWGIVYKGNGQDSSIYVVAKDWQFGVDIDANGVVDLSEKKSQEMIEHFGSTLGLTNGMKIDLISTIRSISKPLKAEDVVGVYDIAPTLETGLPIPHIPVVLTAI